MDLSKKILEKITHDKITPKPRYTFLVKNYLVWAGAGLAIFLGMQAVAIIIYLVKSQDWDIYQSVSNRGEFLILSIPYFWIISLALFIFLAYYNVKHTRSGYKYRFSTILIGYFILTAILGGTSYAFGLGESLEGVFTEKLPVYERMMQYRHKIWQDPEQGLLIGKMFDVSGETLIIRDLERKEWLVDISSTTVPDFVKTKPGILLKMIGEKISENEFKASKLHPIIPKHLMKKPPFDKSPCKMKEIGACARNIR